MFSLQNMSNTKTVVTVVASLAASSMLIPTIANAFISSRVRRSLFSGLQILSRRFSSQLTLVIEEYQGYYIEGLFSAAEAYLGTKLAPSIQRIKARKEEKEEKPAIAIDRDQEIVDVFENTELRWRLVVRENSEFTLREQIRSYELTFHKKHKEKVLNSYLPLILQRAKAIKEERKERMINFLSGQCLTSWAKFDHPMTFGTIVMDEKVKQDIIDDLNTFKNSKEYYRRIGKAWKRGYLINGPPGSGKSSLIAAMANHLNCSIYDLDLNAAGSLTSDDIRQVLLHYLSKTILVIKDIDSTVEISNPRSEAGPKKIVQKQEMLLKLLKFIDGLWLPCREELIIVVTTDDKEKVDPALLVPGRMDIHIHMPYCNYSTFENFATRVLGVYNLGLFDEIEGLLEKVEVTTAEVVRELTKSIYGQASLEGLVKFLHQKKLEKGEQEKIMESKDDERGEIIRGRPFRKGMRGRLRARRC